MRRKLAMILVALLPLWASAQTKVEIDGIWYNLTSETKEAEVTYEYGNINYGYHSDYSGSITIPSKVTYLDEEYRVTSIGYRAFINCSELTDVTIPEGVTSFGESAFMSCSGLSTVTIPESSQLTSIGIQAFGYCRNLTEIFIPEGVTSIGEHAFMYCDSLTTVTIPENSQLTSIGSSAFRSCSNLTEIFIPEGVTSIGDGAFRLCSNLNLISITLPKGITSIGSFTFQGCTNLTAINIPEGVTSIGKWAFSSSGLTAITFPEGVTEIAPHTFRHCQNLGTVVLLSKSLKYVSEYAFANCPELTDMYCYSEAVPSTYDSQIFESSHLKKATLHVPAIALEAYKTTRPWSSFGTIVAIEGEQPDEPTEGWSEWEAVGTAVTVNGKEAMINNLQYWGEGTIAPWEEPITVDQRYDRADPTKKQLRLNGIFNGKEIILDYDSSTATISAEKQSSGYATNRALLESQGVGDPFDEFMFSLRAGTYRPATGVIDMSGTFMLVQEDLGFNTGITLQIEGVVLPIFTGKWDRKYVGREGGEATYTLTFGEPIVKYRKLVIAPGDIVYVSQVQELYKANPKTDLEYEETDSPTFTITCDKMGTYRVVLIPIGADGTAVMDYWSLEMNSYAEPEYASYTWQYIGESTVSEHVGSLLISGERWEEVNGEWRPKYPHKATIEGVETYRRADNPNIIGLRNLFGEKHPYSSMFRYIDQTQDWWVYIDVTDPANVKLLTTPTGVISSEAGYRSFIKASLYPEAAATLSDGVILFPYFTVVMDNLVNQDMQAEFDFKVILPKEEPGEGVEQIMLNSSAAELQHAEVYDLYGRRMLNLENLKSGIYIVNGKKMQLK